MHRFVHVGHGHGHGAWAFIRTHAWVDIIMHGRTTIIDESGEFSKQGHACRTKMHAAWPCYHTMPEVFYWTFMLSEACIYIHLMLHRMRHVPTVRRLNMHRMHYGVCTVHACHPLSSATTAVSTSCSQGRITQHISNAHAHATMEC